MIFVVYMRFYDMKAGCWCIRHVYGCIHAYTHTRITHTCMCKRVKRVKRVERENVCMHTGYSACAYMCYVDMVIEVEVS